MKKIAIYLVCLLTTLCLSACAKELKTAAPSFTSQVMVVTANPHASKAGMDVLQAGGSAVDAAIAIQSVLSLVEPQSSGLAGGAFLVHYDSSTQSIEVYDGRETAPAKVNATMFLNADGQSIGYLNAKNSGLSTGAPGVVDMLRLAHQDHGKLAWGSQFVAAKKLALDGFAVSPRLHYMINRFGKYIPATPADGPTDAYQYFFNDAGEPLAVGQVLKNPAYAKTLDQLANDPRAMYEGQLAEAIVAEVSKSPRAGFLQLEDLRNYRARKQEALCMPYRQWQLCGPPPASSWVGVGMMMALSDYGGAFSDDGADDAGNWSLFANAQRLAYADRDRYLADNEFVDVPLQGMLDQSYLQQRAKAIQANQALTLVTPGEPFAYEQKAAASRGVDATVDHAGTSHFVVVDAASNVVSMTTSVESIFGSTRMVGGMFLNNQLTDFSFKHTDDQGKPIANRVEPGKRPRSSMSPTIVLDQNGQFKMATGSPGGNSILAYTAKTLVGVLAWGLSPTQAVELPNMVARGDSVRIEKDRASPELIQQLRDFGFTVKESAGENSGLSVVVRHNDGRLEGGVDPRREGTIESATLTTQP